MAKKKLTAVFVTDVVGYSRLMGDDHDATVKTLAEYRAVFSSHIEKLQGRIVNAPGDSILAEVSNVVRAGRVRSVFLPVLLGLFALALAACGGGGGGAAIPAADTFTVGGTVSGLTGTLVLQNNGADDLSVSENGAFTFATGLADGATYAVTVKTQPTDQLCTVSNASGTIAGASVSDVELACGAVVITQSGKSPFTLYEEFSSSNINPFRWLDAGRVRKVRSGALVLRTRKAFSADSEMEDDVLVSTPPGASLTRLEAMVTATGFTDAGTRTRSHVELVFQPPAFQGVSRQDWFAARAELRAQGAGLQLRGYVVGCSNADCSTLYFLPGIVGSFPQATPALLGQTYLLSVEYDAANTQFIISADGQMGTVDMAGSSEFATTRFVSGRLRSQVQLVDAPGEVGDISATFDDVATDAGPYDDFSAAQIDRANWAWGETVREVAGNVLHLAAGERDQPKTVALRINDGANISGLSADVTVTGHSVTGGEAMVTLGGAFYNDGSTGDGSGARNGDIIAKIGQSGTDAVYSVERCVSGDCSSLEFLTLAPGTGTPGSVPFATLPLSATHTLRVHWNGALFQFRLNGNPDIAFDPIGAGAPVAVPRAVDPSKSLAAETALVGGEVGFVQATFDQVRVLKTCEAADSAPRERIIESWPCGEFGQIVTRKSDLGGAESDVLVPYMTHRPATVPKGLVLLFPGGNGNANLLLDDITGTLRGAAGNFLVRSAHLFAEAGFLTVTLDNPDHLEGAPIPDFGRYRASMRHAVDIARVIGAVNSVNLPVFLAGTSYGSLTAVSNHRIAGGIAISSAVTTVGGSSLALNQNDPEFPTLETDAVDVPAHVLWHDLDGCGVTTPAGSAALVGAFSAAPSVRSDNFTGGGYTIDGNPCQARGFHGFLGQETTAVGFITAWMDGVLTLREAANPGNRQPVGSDGTFTLLSGTPDITIDLSALAGDPDGDALTFLLPYQVSARDGALSPVSPTQVQYSPLTRGIEDAFAYGVRDGKGGVGTGVITIVVQP